MDRLLCDCCDRELPIYDDGHVSIKMNASRRELIVEVEVSIDNPVDDEPFYYSNSERITITHCPMCGREL